LQPRPENGFATTMDAMNANKENKKRKEYKYMFPL
jgi:hypothetical protein